MTDSKLQPLLDAAAKAMQGNEFKCPECGSDMKCLGGCSAHPDNWYCVNEVHCGYQAWGGRSEQYCKPCLFRSLTDFILNGGNEP